MAESCDFQGDADRCKNDATERCRRSGTREWMPVCEGHARAIRKLSDALRPHGIEWQFEPLSGPGPDDVIMIVCLPRAAGNPGGFDDNCYGPCCRCRTEVQWRPHAPEPSEKICMPCFVKEASPTDTMLVTEETREEVARELSCRPGESPKRES